MLIVKEFKYCLPRGGIFHQNVAQVIRLRYEKQV